MATRHPDLCRRLCRAAGRRGDLRPLRRPHRTQGHADRDPVADGARHVRRGLRSDRRNDRHLGHRFPHVGLARSVFPQHRTGRDRALHPPEYPRDADLRETAGRAPDRENADARGAAQAAEGYRAVGVCANGRTGAVLYLYRVRVHLRDHGAGRHARVAADGGTGGVRGRILHHSAVRSCVGSDRAAAAADVHDRRGYRRRVRISLLRDGR